MTTTTVSTNAQLLNIAKKVCEGHFKDVNATFTAFRDMKVKWARTYQWINFEVSDYLKGAPEEVIEDTLAVIIGRIAGEKKSYSDRTSAYLTADEFVIRNQPTYIERCRGLGDHHGSEINLDMVYHNLIKRGLVEADPMIHIGWSSQTSHRRIGFASTLMKVVGMNPILDDRDLPWTILDYALYKQLAFISMGFDATGANRSEQAEALLDRYPHRAEAEKLAKEYCIIL